MNEGETLTLLRDMRAEMTAGFEMVRSRTHELRNEMHEQNGRIVARLAVVEDRSNRAEAVAASAEQRSNRGALASAGAFLGGVMAGISAAIFGK